MARKKIDIEKAIRLYVNENKHTPEISRVVGCSVQTLIIRLRENGVKIRTSGEAKRKIDFETIRHEYEDLGMSTGTIAKKHGMSMSSIWKRLSSNGAQMRDQKESIIRANTKIPASEHLIICERYKTNKHESCNDIAFDYNVHKTTIANILKKNGIMLEHEGARIKSYKGGITKLHNRIRHCEKAVFWRKACMERDNYQCRISTDTEQLEVHHYPRTFSKIFNTFLVDNDGLDPVSDCDELFDLSQDYELFWDTDNGMTVTADMHKKLHTNNSITNEELVVLYDQGWSCKRISQYFGKSSSFVRARFMSIDKDRKPAGFYNQQRSAISEEIQSGVLKAYVRGDVVRRICKQYKIASSTLYKILKNKNIVPGDRKKHIESKALQDKDRVISLNKSGVNIQELARMYEVSDTTIRNILK